MIDFGYEIKSKRIALGLIDERNLYLLLEWRNNFNIRKWCRQTDLITIDEQAKWYQKINEDASIKMYSIYYDNNTIGVCGFTSVNHIHNTAEFSIYVAPEHQRKGFAESALKTLLSHGFEDLNLNRIYGETFEGNPGIKLYKKLGFTKEGTHQQTYYKCGKYINSYTYSILKEEFKPVD
jgi:RimJ/RimL family protein N-acetyltransferase